MRSLLRTSLPVEGSRRARLGGLLRATLRQLLNSPDTTPPAVVLPTFLYALETTGSSATWGWAAVALNPVEVRRVTAVRERMDAMVRIFLRLCETVQDATMRAVESLEMRDLTALMEVCVRAMHRAPPREGHPFWDVCARVCERAGEALGENFLSPTAFPPWGAEDILSLLLLTRNVPHIDEPHAVLEGGASRAVLSVLTGHMRRFAVLRVVMPTRAKLWDLWKKHQENENWETMGTWGIRQWITTVAVFAASAHPHYAAAISAELSHECEFDTALDAKAMLHAWLAVHPASFAPVKRSTAGAGKNATTPTPTRAPMKMFDYVPTSPMESSENADNPLESAAVVEALDDSPLITIIRRTPIDHIGVVLEGRIAGQSANHARRLARLHRLEKNRPDGSVMLMRGSMILALWLTSTCAGGKASPSMQEIVIDAVRTLEGFEDASPQNAVRRLINALGDMLPLKVANLLSSRNLERRQLLSKKHSKRMVLRKQDIRTLMWAVKVLTSTPRSESNVREFLVRVAAAWITILYANAYGSAVPFAMGEEILRDFPHLTTASPGRLQPPRSWPLKRSQWTSMHRLLWISVQLHALLTSAYRKHPLLGELWGRIPWSRPLVPRVPFDMPRVKKELERLSECPVVVRQPSALHAFSIARPFLQVRGERSGAEWAEILPIVLTHMASTTDDAKDGEVVKDVKWEMSWSLASEEPNGLRLASLPWVGSGDTWSFSRAAKFTSHTFALAVETLHAMYQRHEIVGPVGEASPPAAKFPTVEAGRMVDIFAICTPYAHATSALMKFVHVAAPTATWAAFDRAIKLRSCEGFSELLAALVVPLSKNQLTCEGLKSLAKMNTVDRAATGSEAAVYQLYVFAMRQLMRRATLIQLIADLGPSWFDTMAHLCICGCAMVMKLRPRRVTDPGRVRIEILAMEVVNSSAGLMSMKENDTHTLAVSVSCLAVSAVMQLYTNAVIAKFFLRQWLDTTLETMLTMLKEGSMAWHKCFKALPPMTWTRFRFLPHDYHAGHPLLTSAVAMLQWVSLLLRGAVRAHSEHRAELKAETLAALRSVAEMIAQEVFKYIEKKDMGDWKSVDQKIICCGVSAIGLLARTDCPSLVDMASRVMSKFSTSDDVLEAELFDNAHSMIPQEDDVAKAPEENEDEDSAQTTTAKAKQNDQRRHGEKSIFARRRLTEFDPEWTNIGNHFEKEMVTLRKIISDVVPIMTGSELRLAARFDVDNPSVYSSERIYNVIVNTALAQKMEINISNLIMSITGPARPLSTTRIRSLHAVHAVRTATQYAFARLYLFSPRVSRDNWILRWFEMVLGDHAPVILQTYSRMIRSPYMWRLCTWVGAESVDSQLVQLSCGSAALIFALAIMRSLSNIGVAPTDKATTIVGLMREGKDIGPEVEKLMDPPNMAVAMSLAFRVTSNGLIILASSRAAARHGPDPPSSTAEDIDFFDDVERAVIDVVRSALIQIIPLWPSEWHAMLAEYLIHMVNPRETIHWMRTKILKVLFNVDLFVALTPHLEQLPPSIIANISQALTEYYGKGRLSVAEFLHLAQYFLPCATMMNNPAVAVMIALHKDLREMNPAQLGELDGFELLLFVCRLLSSRVLTSGETEAMCAQVVTQRTDLFPLRKGVIQQPSRVKAKSRRQLRAYRLALVMSSNQDEQAPTDTHPTAEEEGEEANVGEAQRSVGPVLITHRPLSSWETIALMLYASETPRLPTNMSSGQRFRRLLRRIVLENVLREAPVMTSRQLAIVCDLLLELDQPWNTIALTSDRLLAQTTEAIMKRSLEVVEVDDESDERNYRSVPALSTPMLWRHIANFARRQEIRADDETATVVPTKL